jgi:hypothetical protein
MHKRGAQRMATITLAVGAALAWAHGANAAGAMNIATCQLLSAPNTVYSPSARARRSSSAMPTTMGLPGSSRPRIAC